MELWRSGFVEPAEPPPLPLHILAQQILALALQERGVGRGEWLGWVRGVPAFRDFDRTLIERVVGGMLDRQVLGRGRRALAWPRAGAYGRKNFLDLVSVFTAAAVLLVLHGRQELGFVDESTFPARRDDGPPVLLLAGRAWRVTHLDWKRRKAFVELAEDEGRSRRGGGQFLGGEPAAIRGVLAGDEEGPHWSRRATARMREVREAYPRLDRRE